MTAGSGGRPPGMPQGQTARQYIEHSSANRVNTDAVIVDSLRKEYPQLHLTVVPTSSCNLVSFATLSGQGAIAPIDNEKDRLTWRIFVPPSTRLNGGSGSLADRVKFAKYLLDWGNKEFVVFVVNGRDGQAAYPDVSNQYILSSSIESTNRLLLEAGKWGNELHKEIWVWDGGFWQKSEELWESVQKSSWDDVILDKDMKKAIITDVNSFFDSRDVYERLKVPWKRGVIYYGPPGNGKTISIKATMHTLYERKESVPTLYVRSLASFAGPEYSIGMIFGLARRTAPCYLVFEDLDSIVTDSVRSYFLNAVDGLSKNDGVFMIGSTNHLDRLDPGIAKRPSRFDRKYFFDNPNEEERILYAKYWQKKLDDNEDVDFPDKLCTAVAKITDKFSFAFLQELFVASLLSIARDRDQFAERVCLDCLQSHSNSSSGASCDREVKDSFKGLSEFIFNVRRLDQDDKGLDDLILWREIKKQARILRQEIGEDTIRRRS